jgi:putative addiction module component (TIGR02574 family)
MLEDVIIYRGGTAMPVSVESLGIDRLSVRERLELIEQIWDSLPEQVNPDEVPEWHLAELAKRRAAADAAPGVGKPWREALARFESGS